MEEIKIMEMKGIQLVPADISLAEQAAAYYKRNRSFLEEFEPTRSEEYFSLEYQKKVLKAESDDRVNMSGFRFYIKAADQPSEIIGMIGLSNVVWGSFQSAFLGYKLDKELRNRGYMTMAVSMLVEYAFRTLKLHRIEANVMPRNLPSLRVLEKNGFVNEGISRDYLKINGVWEDHIHMVKINDQIEN